MIRGVGAYWEPYEVAHLKGQMPANVQQGKSFYLCQLCTDPGVHYPLTSWMMRAVVVGGFSINWSFNRYSFILGVPYPWWCCTPSTLDSVPYSPQTLVRGGARCLEMLDYDMKGGGSISPIIITGGKAGDIAVHDFRCIAIGKAKRERLPKNEFAAYDASHAKSLQVGELNSNGMIWHIDKAHAGSVQCISAIPGTSLFISGGKDGDIKLWDVNKCELLNHWPKVHDKHMFLQHNIRGFGGVVQAAVTDIKPVSSGFLTCGGDGVLRLFRQEILFRQGR